MKMLFLPILIGFIISCGSGSTSQTEIPVDYKFNEYHIYLGQNYKISDSLIDWRWAAMADDDDKIDSLGKDVFNYLGEPLIVYNGSEYLPYLMIKTEHNMLFSFECSVLFDRDSSANWRAHFLLKMAPSIRKLENDSVRNSLITRGEYKYQGEGFLETILLKEATDIGFDSFSYEIKKNEP